MPEPYRVFTIGHDQDLLELLMVVLKEEAGCLVEGSTPAPDNLERIRQFQPNLVLLNIPPQETEHLQLLDQLRTDEKTSTIPVLSLCTMENICELATASYNVRGFVVLPFDVQQLLDQVNAILSLPPLDVPSAMELPGARTEREASLVLARKAREVVVDWVERMKGTETLRNQQSLRLGQRINHVPALLWGTVLALRTGAVEQLVKRHGPFERVAVAHAQLRRRQGLGLPALMLEYELLRDAIWESLHTESGELGWTVDDLFRIGNVVHRVLDEVVTVAIESYKHAEFKNQAGLGERQTS